MEENSFENAFQCLLIVGGQNIEDPRDDFPLFSHSDAQSLLTALCHMQTYESAVLVIMNTADELLPHETIDKHGCRRRGDAQLRRKLFHRDAGLTVDKEQCVELRHVDLLAVTRDHFLPQRSAERERKIRDVISGLLCDDH